MDGLAPSNPLARCARSLVFEGTRSAVLKGRACHDGGAACGRPSLTAFWPHEPRHYTIKQKIVRYGKKHITST